MIRTNECLIVGSSPHIHSGYTIPHAMREVFIALLPTVLASLYFFGVPASFVIVVSVFAAVFAEYACRKIMRRSVTVSDGSAALTGLLLALCLPPGIPLWIAALGAVFSIVLGKQVFGGLGCNVFNPAHIGRAILLTSFPAQMTDWGLKNDALSGATPLLQLKTLENLLAPSELMRSDSLPNFFNLFTGNTYGSLGETCVPALLAGGLYLIWRGHIDWRVPCYYIGSVFLLMAGYGLFKGYGLYFPLYHIFGGGLFLGAFFMATDWVTSPLTVKGRIIFALGLGFFTCLIRLKSNYAEGVCYSILLMNMLVPLIDRYTKRGIFGGAAK